MVQQVTSLVENGTPTILGGGFTWGISESLGVDIKVQKLTKAVPEEWTDVMLFPTKTASAVAGSFITYYEINNNATVQWLTNAVGQYRWLITVNGEVSVNDYVYFNVVDTDNIPECGTLQLLFISSQKAVLSYTGGKYFDHGVLRVVNNNTQVAQEQEGFMGLNEVTGLDVGMWYTFQMDVYNEEGELGCNSNIEIGLVPHSHIIPDDAPNTPFFEIVVRNDPNPLSNNGTLISWGLRRTFCDPGPYAFEVQWAETPRGQWHTVETGPLTDTYFAIDGHKRMCSKEMESYYRIMLTTPTASYLSFAKGSNSYWKKRDWLLGREICRKERLLMRKFTGWEGYVLKRKIWGEKCPRCADFDSDEVGEGKCPVCFGTGKIGGYWEGYPTYAYNMEGGPTQFKELDDTVGMKEDIGIKSMRMLAYPHLSTNDIFVHEESGRRYYIRPVNIAAEIKGVPIVYVVTLKLAPFTDVAYEVPKVPIPYVDPGSLVTPEVIPELETPPETASYYIFWSMGEWYLGPVLGETTSSLYRTNAAYPLADGLDSYSWNAINEDGGELSITFIDQSTFNVSIEGNAGLTGSYEGIGDYEGLASFGKA